MSSRPPRLLRRIVQATLPYEDRETLAQELDELYVLRVQRYGQVRANLWYARETMMFVLRVLLMPYLTRRGDVRRTLADVVRADVGYGVRQLRRAPVFTIVATLSLAVGIGVTVSALSFLNVLFRPLPLPDADRLVRVYTSDADGHHEAQGRSSYADYEDIAASGVFENLVAEQQRRVALTIAEDPPVMERLSFVSPNYFSALGVRPLHGRGFRAAGDEPELVLNYLIWDRLFARNPNIIGRTVLLNGAEFVVVGIMPRGFNGLDRDGIEPGWVPMPQLARIVPGVTLSARGDRSVGLAGRLNPTLTAAAAQTRLRDLAAALATRYPQEWIDANHQPRLISFLDERKSLIHPNQRGELLVVIAGTGALVLLVLLLACANVAGMLLARALERSHEVAVRITLGATRTRIVAQLLTESLLLALLGGTTGVLVMTWTFGMLRRTTELAGVNLTPDWRVLLGAVAVSFMSALLFGLAPIVQTIRTDTRAALASTHTAGRGRTRLRGVVISVQVAAATLILLVAVAAQRGVRAQLSADPGFDVRGLIAVRVPRDPFGSDTARANQYLHQLQEHLEAIPGVQHVARAESLPFGGAWGSARLELDGAVSFVGRNDVSPDFFAVLGLPLLRGRLFTEHDVAAAPFVAVVNRTFAQQFGPDVLGKFIDVGGQRGLQVVGVVADVLRRDVTETAQPMVYAPLAQKNHAADVAALGGRGGSRNPGAGGKAPNEPMGVIILVDGGRDFLVRVPPSLEATALISLQKMLRAQFPDAVMPQITTIADMIALQARPQRVASMVALGAAAVELGLAAAGLYGLLLFALLARTRELGLRLALGAAPRQASWAVLRDGLRYAFIGAACGLLLGVPAVIAGSQSMIGTRASDPIPFVTSTLAIVIAAAAAALVPAVRAARTQPGHALRHD